MAKKPWYLPTPLESRATEAYRRYLRSLRLDQFARELAAWKLAGLLGDPALSERVAYRRLCLERWQEYLDGRIDPPEGRKPKRRPK